MSKWGDRRRENQVRGQKSLETTNQDVSGFALLVSQPITKHNNSYHLLLLWLVGVVSVTIDDMSIGVW